MEHGARVQRAVLGVEKEPVEAGHPKHLDHLRRWQRDHRPGQQVAAQQPLAQ
jgi:hypothetical protein